MSLIKKDKRILFISDMHAGDNLGLTPAHLVHPGFCYAKQMRDYWSWYSREIRDAGTFDIIINAGDCVHGNPKKDSRSLNTNDMDEQVKIAILNHDIIQATPNARWFFAYGTDCHVGGQMDFEKNVARHFDAMIKTEIKLNVNGYKLSVMHKRGFGKSSGLNGAGGALGKAGINSFIGDIKRTGESSRLFINGHTHDYQYYGNANYMVLSLPALQIGNRDVTPYARGFVSAYDVGFITATITKRGHFMLDEPHIYTMLFNNKGGKEYENV